MCSGSLSRSQVTYVLVVHVVAEAPVVFRTYITFAVLRVITPPHVTEGKEILNLLAVCVVLIIEQQRFTIPVEPQIFKFILRVVILVDFLCARRHSTVVAPETEFRHLITLILHLGHSLKENVPSLGIQYGICKIEDKHIYTRVGKHRYILAYHILVAACEIAKLRLTPMICKFVSPQRVVVVKTRLRVFLKNLCHITGVG